MNIMVISKDNDKFNEFNNMATSLDSLFTLTRKYTVDEYLDSDGYKRYDGIFIIDGDVIQLAEQLKSGHPQANIILISKKPESCPEINMVDCIERPLTKDKLIHAAHNLKHALKSNPSENVVISGFKSLIFKRHLHSDDPLEIKWRTSRTKELFAFLLVNANEFQSKVQIQQSFWPDLNENNVNQQLYSTIYEIRKVLEKNNIPLEIISESNKYMLKNESVSVDYQVFQDELNKVDKIDDDNHERLKRLLKLYKGHLLADEDYKWIVNKRDKLKFHWLMYMQKLNDYYVENDRLSEAIMVNLQVREYMPNNKKIIENLNKLYTEIGEPVIEL